jgi:hypothetical protein
MTENLNDGHGERVVTHSSSCSLHPEFEPTTTESLRELIGEAVYQAGQEHEFPEIQADVQTFAEAGVMTRDEGLVIRLGDREFQVTIVQSR